MSKRFTWSLRRHCSGAITRNEPAPVQSEGEQKPRYGATAERVPLGLELKCDPGCRPLLCPTECLDRGHDVGAGRRRPASRRGGTVQQTEFTVLAVRLTHFDAQAREMAISAAT